MNEQFGIDDYNAGEDNLDLDSKYEEHEQDKLFSEQVQIYQYDIQDEKKKKENYVDILGREKKKKKVVSEEENLLKKLVANKRKIKGKKDLFDAKLAEISKKEISEKEKKFLFDIYSITVDIKRLGIAKNLVKNPILIPCYTTFQTNILTTDLLYWGYKLKEYSETLESLKYVSRLTKLYMCSYKPIKFPNDAVNEYYVEDFEKKVSAPGWIKNVTNTQAIGEIKDTFNLYGEEYNVYKPNNNVPIYVAKNIPNYNVNILLQVLNQAKYIYKKGGLTEGMKEIKVKGYYFFENMIYPTIFCPDNILVNENIDYGVLYFLEIDPDKFINQTKTKNNEIPTVVNLVYWDYLTSAVELLTVTMLTLNVRNNRGRLGVLKQFSDNTRLFSAFKAHFKLFEKIVLSFLDGFHRRVSIDRMRKIYKDATMFLQERQNILLFEKEYSIVDEFVTVFEPYTQMMYNFLHRSPEEYVELIQKVCSLVLNVNTDVSTLEIQIRAVGLKLHEVLYNGKNKMIMTIRSPNAFLFNTIGNTDHNMLLEYIEELKKRVILERKAIEDEKKKSEQLTAAIANKILEKQNEQLVLKQKEIEDKKKEDIININLPNIKMNIKQPNTNAPNINKESRNPFSMTSNISSANPNNIDEGMPIITNKVDIPVDIPDVTQEPENLKNTIFYSTYSNFDNIPNRKEGDFPITRSQIDELSTFQKNELVIPGIENIIEKSSKIQKKSQNIDMPLNLDDVLENPEKKIGKGGKPLKYVPMTKRIGPKRLGLSTVLIERARQKGRNKDRLNRKENEIARSKIRQGKRRGDISVLYSSTVPNPIKEVSGENVNEKMNIDDGDDNEDINKYI